MARRRRARSAAVGRRAARRDAPARPAARDARGARRSRPASRAASPRRARRAPIASAAARRCWPSSPASAPGRAVLLADAAPLVNSRLARRDDAAFALALAGAGRPVAFVESVHGYGRASGFGRAAGPLPRRARPARPRRARCSCSRAGAGSGRRSRRGASSRRRAPPTPRRSPARSCARARPAAAIAPVVEEARSLLRGAGGQRRGAAAGRRARRGTERGRGERDRARRVEPAAALAAARGPGAHQRAEGRGMIEAFDRVRAQVGRVIVGQEQTVDLALVAAATGGHVLLEGPPGVAKTLAVNALAQALGLELPARAVHARHAALGRHGDDDAARGRARVPARARCSRTCCSPTRSTARRRRPRRRCSRRCRSARSRSTASRGRCRRRSSSPRRRTRSSTRAPIRCPEAQLDRFLFRIDVGYPDEAGRGGDPAPRPPRRARAVARRASRPSPAPDDLERAGALIDETTVSDEVARLSRGGRAQDARAALRRARREPARGGAPAGGLARGGAARRARRS